MTAWKDLERRVCRAFGAQRRPSVGGEGWARGSDDDGTAPFAIECKRTTRYSLRRAWVEQARANARADGRPWLLVVAEHGDRRPIAVLDFGALVALWDALVEAKGGHVADDGKSAARAVPVSEGNPTSSGPPFDEQASEGG